MTTGFRVTCEELVRELPDFLDRELSTFRHAELRRHLDGCARCLRKCRFERSLLDQIRSRLANVALPPGLTARVASAIAMAVGEPGRARPQVSR